MQRQLGGPLSNNQENRDYLNLFTQLTLQFTPKLRLDAGLNFNTTSYRLEDRFVHGIDLVAQVRDLCGVHEEEPLQLLVELRDQQRAVFKTSCSARNASSSTGSAAHTEFAKKKQRGRRRSSRH